MFKLKTIKIDGFWHTHTANASILEGVNIIIGRNGTGKTTFMNIVYAVLVVDTDALCELAFESVELSLTDGTRTRTIRAIRIESDKMPFSSIQYRISRHKYDVPLASSDDYRSFSPYARRRFFSQAQQVRERIEGIVSVASLSVYRISGDSDRDMRERGPRRVVSPVDQRLQNLNQRLTLYQLELSNAARKVIDDLQKDVLLSLLYAEPENPRYSQMLDFSEDDERAKLATAYKQLGLKGQDINRRIQNHISLVGNAIKSLTDPSPSTATNGEESDSSFDLSALEAYRLTNKIVEKSLAAEERVRIIFRQSDRFLETLSSFITDKKFVFKEGVLTIDSESLFDLTRLSSGEKQLLILFVEALLQREQRYIFLADEPELSLHIAWQRKIIWAIQNINPNAQVIAATHSPEVAGKYREAILDMEDILSVK